MLQCGELKEMLDYNPNTGIFTWKNCLKKPYKNGKEAGGIGLQGYYFVRIKGVLYRRARLAWFYTYGYWPNEIDHIDRNRKNDAISNLRNANSSQNKANRIAKEREFGRGVYLHHNKYVATISFNGQRIHLGLYDTEAEAIAAYRGAATICFGEFAYEK